MHFDNIDETDLVDLIVFSDHSIFGRLKFLPMTRMKMDLLKMRLKMVLLGQITVLTL